MCFLELEFGAQCVEEVRVHGGGVWLCPSRVGEGRPRRFSSDLGLSLQKHIHGLRIVSGKEGMPLWLKLQAGQSWLSPSGDGDLLEAP